MYCWRKVKSTTVDDPLITYRSLIVNAKKSNGWDLTNDVLYRLCRENPGHKDTNVIAAKLLLIGRSYAAALERRKNKSIGQIGDDFYLGIAAPAIRDSELDRRLKSLSREKRVGLENADRIISVHKYLMGEFDKLTNLKKRSLASKYLHFHLPHLFFIYDSRALSGLRVFKSIYGRLPKARSGNQDHDEEYAVFVLRALAVRDRIELEYKTALTTRQLDNLLVEIANAMMRKM